MTKHTPPPSSLRKTGRFLRTHWKSLLMFFFGFCFLVGGGLFLWAATLKLPDLSTIQNLKIQQSTQIYDRTGKVLLYNLNSNAQRTVVPLSQISPLIQNATVSIEDPNFYTDIGIEPMAILRAVIADITPGGVLQGGSTITQQVVKNTLLNDNKTISRKLKEWVLAIKMNQRYSKQQILELYLNAVPYGGNIYGVEQASETFFGKHASDVDLAEAAYLAAVLPAPSYLSPYGEHKDELDARKNLVLDRMFQHGYISAQERDQAKAEVVAFQPPHSNSITAPHFVFYVQQYLEQKYGADALEQNGWKVITSLDADLQAKAEEVVQAHIQSQQQKFNASNTGLIAIDPKTGQILAMVGSRNYFDKTIDGNFNVTLAKRQPGSTFKPFAYAEAFIKGYTPDTVVFDVPTQFSTSCQPQDTTNNTPPCYAPVNYDNKFLGPITLRDAIAQSRNVPSIKVLYLAGLNDTLQLAKAMGVSTLGNVNQYGLTLVLGGGEVTLLDMTSAYGTFATDGVHYNPVSVLKIEDQNGNIIEDNTQPTGTQVLPPTVAQEINDILSDPVARAELGENEYLSFPGSDVAVKTGTTNNYKDAWTIGYSPDIVIGMWVGNNDDSPMTHNVSGFIVGPMWHEIMQYALSKYPQDVFTRSKVDESNLKPVLRGLWQQPGSDGKPHSILYWVNTADPLGPAPTNPASDPQFPYWEYPVEQWIQVHGFPAMPPTSTSTASTTTSAPYLPAQTR